MTGAARASVCTAILVVAAFALLVVRELGLGAAAVRACDERLSGGDLLGAVDSAADAARARAPGSPYPAVGYARLAAIAQAAEERDDVATALAALRADRAARVATLSWARRTDAIDHDDEAIARLSSRAPSGTVAPRDPEATRLAVLAALARDDRPGPLTFAWLAAGAVLFFAGAGRLVALGPGAKVREIALRAAVPLGGLVLSILACAMR